MNSLFLFSVLFTWVFHGKAIQQVKAVKYLGLNFQYKLSWVPQRIAVIKLAKLTSQAILRFFYSILSTLFIYHFCHLISDRK